jgi:hypothetical protein
MRTSAIAIAGQSPAVEPPATKNWGAPVLARRPRPAASCWPPWAARLRIQQAVAAERSYMLEVLAELIAEVRARFMDELEKAYDKNFNMVRLDIDALRHEIRKFASAGVIELPRFLASERHHRPTITLRRPLQSRPRQRINPDRDLGALTLRRWCRHALSPRASNSSKRQQCRQRTTTFNNSAQLHISTILDAR